MNKGAAIGVVGLGVMGRNLALNLAGRAIAVVAYDSDAETRARFAATAPAGIVVAADPAELARQLAPPRVVLVMVPAGAAVDVTLDALTPRLAQGDVVIDGGNSHFRDTERRSKELTRRGIELIGLGISGGEAGAREGPSLVAGGKREAWLKVEPLLARIAARADSKPALAFLGAAGAGHFVKMVHNGIEYAQMQLIAEACFVMRHRLALAYPAMARVCAEWNQGALESYLMSITADLLSRHEAVTGRPVVELIVDRAAHKGTGQWTVTAALELGMAAPTIAAAVFARFISADPRRASTDAGEMWSGREANVLPVSIDDLAAALTGATLSVYGQGLAVLDAARLAFGWPLDLAALRTAWRSGCIIRARLLDEMLGAAIESPREMSPLALPAIAERLVSADDGWRRTVSAATMAGLPIPGFGSALAHIDALRAPRLWTALIQAQRDYFGAHGIERTDRPGTFHLADFTVRPT